MSSSRAPGSADDGGCAADARRDRHWLWEMRAGFAVSGGGYDELLCVGGGRAACVAARCLPPRRRLEAGAWVPFRHQDRSSGGRSSSSRADR